VTENMGFTGEVIWDVAKPDGQMRKPSDITKLRRLRPDFEFVSVTDGVKKTVEWFLASYPNIRV